MWPRRHFGAAAPESCCNKVKANSWTAMFFTSPQRTSSWSHGISIYSHHGILSFWDRIDHRVSTATAMRLFLLPISARRTLIYCERVQQQITSGQKPPITERIINRASETWAQWERAEKGWQKQITVQGNRLFRRIPYEEWGLKSIPPATKKRLEDIDNGKVKFECLYPGSFIKENKVPEILKALATERQGLHRKRMWNSILWLPVTIPFTIVPV